MSKCLNCDKEKIPVEDRCSCRLDWQTARSFKMNEAIENFFLIYDTTERTTEDWDKAAIEFRRVFIPTMRTPAPRSPG